jgi:glycosyltransferase involved in cell wall biosynthesis
MGSDAADSTKLGDLAASEGLRRVHILAWRDLDDVEAGGSEIHASEIARRWAEAGIDVLMRTSHAQGQLSEVARDGYRVVRRRGRHLVFLDAPVQELARRGGGRDGLLEVWNGLPFFSPVWARGRRATFVHHVHADMWRQVMSPGLARLGEALELRVAPRVYRSTRVLTPSASSRQVLIDRLGLPPANVTAVPNGVHPRFRPGGQRAERPLVVAVARLVPHKRIDLLIRAAAEARAAVPDLELVVAGEGYERRHLEHVIQEQDAEGWAHLVGHVTDDELVEHYRRAWVVAAASSIEGWGMTITEAAACGTPAVATRIAGHVDVVDDGVTGLLARDQQELAGAIGAVLRDPALRDRLGAAAHQRSQSLTWDRTALSVLRGVAGLPSR